MKARLICALLMMAAQPNQAQEYLWPTDASRHLTSSFGESRPRRFHTGIDVKTWNRTGYKIFATRAGHLERMSISPFGYGRVLYLRLDTGEIAVYAHLERFNRELQALAEQEQERRGTFRIDKYFEAGAVPVKQGDLLGYTGQSGIGTPHLHFELRDARNRPLNPLRKGFTVADDVRPTITQIVVSPLEPGAMVDGDYMPRAIRPGGTNGRLKIAEPIRVSGKIGLAVDAFDRATGVNNEFSVYRFQLFIDGSLQFQSQFDRLSFDENKLIELAQDYALQRRGWGRPQKLYREAANTLGVYSNLNSADGAIIVAPNRNGAPHGPDTMLIVEGDQPVFLDAGKALAWGLHDFRIVAEDFHGNQTTVEGRLLAGPHFPLIVNSQVVQANHIELSVSSAAREHEIQTITVQGSSARWTANKPSNWRELKAEVAPPPMSLPDSAVQETMSAGFSSEDTLATNTNDTVTVQTLTIRRNGASLVRIQATDAHGIASYPAFVLADSGYAGERPLQLLASKDFYRDYLRLELSSNRPLTSSPQATWIAAGRNFTTDLLPKEPNLFVGVVPLAEIAADSVWLSISAQVDDSSQSVWQEVFGNVEIAPGKGGTLRAADERMRVSFSAASPYWPIYGRVFRDDGPVADRRVLGPVYRVEPQDAPLREAAMISIAYPDTISTPRQLGLAYRDKERWDFLAAQVNAAERRLSAEVTSLREFALMRDDQPPVLTPQAPLPGSTTADRRPELVFQVYDSTSGFASELAIEMRLDGQKLIAEYDPERDLIFYRPKRELASGPHTLTASAEDRCGNVARREVRFIVP